MYPRIARFCDEQTTAPVGSPWTLGRNGELVADVPMTWVGVQTYMRMVDGKAVPVRILHRPEIMNSDANRELLGMISPTHGHPIDTNKEPIWVVPANFQELNVGHIGDTIRVGTVAGVEVPIGRAHIFTPACQDAIHSGLIGSSLGYISAEVGPHPREVEEVDGEPVGVWEGADGPQAYDLEHLCCPAYLAAPHDDPRVRQLYVDELIDDAKIKLFGPNHHANGIAEGRGAELTEIQPVTDSAPPSAAGAPTSVYFRRPETRTMKTKKYKFPMIGDQAEQVQTVETDNVDAVLELLDAAMERLVEARAMLDTAEGEQAVAEQAAEDAKAKVGEEQAARAEAENERDELKLSLAKVQGERDGFELELKPHREAALIAAREAARPLIGDAVDTCSTAAEIDRKLAAKHKPEYGERTADGTAYKKTTGEVRCYLDGLGARQAPARTPSPSFTLINKNGPTVDSAPVNTTHPLAVAQAATNATMNN